MDENTNGEVEVSHIDTSRGDINLRRDVVLYSLECGRLKGIYLLTENCDIALTGIERTHRRCRTVHVVFKAHIGLKLLETLLPGLDQHAHEVEDRGSMPP